MLPERDHSSLRRRHEWREFERAAVQWALISVACLAMWFIQGADGVLTIRRRDIQVGFWPAWPLVIGFFIVSTKAWATFARDDEDVT